MRRKVKIAFLILLVATVVLALACYLHVQAYNRYVQKVTGRYKPVWLWGLSIVLWLVGSIMIFAWIRLFAELRRKMRKCWKEEPTKEEEEGPTSEEVKVMLKAEAEK